MYLCTYVAMYLLIHLYMNKTFLGLGVDQARDVDGLLRCVRVGSPLVHLHVGEQVVS